MENHEFFKNSLKKFDLKTLHTGLEKLEIVSVVLDPAVDDQQKIVETFNATETIFSQVDLIRNYVLINLETHFPKTIAYENFWHPMEQLFADKYAKRSDSFMRNYLTLKMRRVAQS